MQDRLRVSHADIDERNLEPTLLANARGGGSGELPLMLDAEIVERRLHQRLELRAADDQYPRAPRAHSGAEPTSRRRVAAVANP